ncbi:hypothetical protein [Myxacorys almedinensis]|uniref:Sporulation/spore germination protein n=1 Tax=Myxacorys almedinensis A TaxID=2690445 RepID=A0A8J8CKT6_9CYAN|nr:hypothetical protein [Myxacorys almedinensis]NDJ18936.1 hypothetical protein [Myxacorys almedinensis A]
MANLSTQFFARHFFARHLGNLWRRNPAQSAASKLRAVYLLLLLPILLMGCQSTPVEAPQPSVSADSASSKAVAQPVQTKVPPPPTASAVPASKAAVRRTPTKAPQPATSISPKSGSPKSGSPKSGSQKSGSPKPVTQPAKNAAKQPTSPKPSAQPRQTKAPQPATSISPKSGSPKPVAQPAKNAAKQPTSPDQNTIPVTLYELDNQCNRFVSKKIRVSKVKPLEKTVGQVLGNLNSDDFSVSGYRVSVAKGVATIDFRTPTNSKRQLRSLSNCEQLALYGGLRKTLTGNKVLKIKSVQFADRGQKLKP